MDRFKQIETFVSVANRGSLSAAAQAEGVAPAIIGRRIDALEERLGVKLLVRTTRRITLTFEGSAFLEDCQRILNDFHNAEASVSLGGVKASGHVRVTAPAGFGRRHVAPLLPAFLDANRDVTISLDLSDRLADIVNEGIDVAIRIGQLDDSSLVGVKLASNQRVVVASPGYLSARGTPRAPADLSAHDCLTFGNYGNQARVLDEVLRLKLAGIGVLVSTHHPEHAFRIADRVLLLAEGRLVAQGTTQATLTSATLTALYDRAIEVATVRLADGSERRVCVPAAGA